VKEWKVTDQDKVLNMSDPDCHLDGSILRSVKSRSSAQKREAEIKSWTRRQKIRELGLGIST